MRHHRRIPAKTPTIGDLLRDENGIAVVWVTVGMVALFAVGALLVDAGRMFNLHSQMQSYADHVALAAAAELDGDGNAITRAIEAATGPSGVGPLVHDTQNFAIGAADLAVNCLTFLSKLGTGNGPAGSVDGDQVLCNTCGGTACSAELSRQARYVQASVEPRTMNYALAPVLRAFGIGIADSATVGSYAIAGFTRSVCNAPPLMFCNPDEPPYPGGGEYTPVVGRQILLKSKGAGSAWAPGDFGLLDPVDSAGQPICSGGGANQERCVLALVEPNTQCVEDKADIKPGQAVSVHAGLNVRFDIWDPPLNSDKNNPAFAPARNVTKGKVFQGNNCTTNKLENPPPPPNDSVRLPRDPCFGNGTCTRFGDGNTALWSGGSSPLIGYWQTNHGTNPPVNFPTRYEAYRYEIENNVIIDKSSLGGENGRPTCSNQVVNDSRNRDRRVLIVAVINCIEWGDELGGAAEDIPIKAFAKVFMTEPVGIDSPNVDDIWVEELGVVKAGDETGVLHDLPVLYR